MNPKRSSEALRLSADEVKQLDSQFKPTSRDHRPGLTYLIEVVRVLNYLSERKVPSATIKEVCQCLVLLGRAEPSARLGTDVSVCVRRLGLAVAGNSKGQGTAKVYVIPTEPISEQVVQLALRG